MSQKVCLILKQILMWEISPYTVLQDYKILSLRDMLCFLKTYLVLGLAPNSKLFYTFFILQTINFMKWNKLNRCCQCLSLPPCIMWEERNKHQPLFQPFYPGLKILFLLYLVSSVIFPWQLVCLTSLHESKE